jgi:putative sporulation protein YyaC
LAVSQKKHMIDSTKADAVYMVSTGLSDLIKNKSFQNIVFLCIGTDRSTGDCLGPLVGERLISCSKFKNICVFGTLNEPVHAKNLDSIIRKIYRTIDNPYVIAVDASLGRVENIGNINIYEGPVYPGAGVNKDLKPVGNISITGIVNISGFMEYLVLQSTRLSQVMKLADVIYLGITDFLSDIESSAVFY